MVCCRFSPSFSLLTVLCLVSTAGVVGGVSVVSTCFFSLCLVSSRCLDRDPIVPSCTAFSSGFSKSPPLVMPSPPLQLVAVFADPENPLLPCCGNHTHKSSGVLIGTYSSAHPCGWAPSPLPRRFFAASSSSYAS